MSSNTVKVSNVSLEAKRNDIENFFSFSGRILHITMMSESERSQIVYVTFENSEGADMAVLLSGATIIDSSVIISHVSDNEMPNVTLAQSAVREEAAGGTGMTFQKAEDVVSGMLAKGFILGKDAVSKAKAFDEKHQLTSTATAKVSSLDKRVGLTEKISMGASAVNDKVKEMDQRFQVSEKTKSVIAAAEEKVSTAGSAILKNKYVFTGASWVAGAFSRVSKAAGEVGSKTREKVVMAEEQQKREMVNRFAEVHLSDSVENSPKKPGENSSKHGEDRFLL